MKYQNKKLAIALVLGFVAIMGCSNSNSKNNDSGDGSETVNPRSKNNDANGGVEGVHFKIDGKQYDIAKVRAISNKELGFVMYNSGLPGFPDTTITVSVGTNFTGGTGTFKSDVNNKGLVFGFVLFNGGLSKEPICGYGAGQDVSNSGETIAGTPVSITVNTFSVSGSNYIKGNVTAQGTFSGTIYDIKNKKTVALTDGTFNVNP